MTDTVEEKILERQAIKLKLDQLVIQGGRQVDAAKNVNKEEYEKILVHGAKMILKKKLDNYVKQTVDIDLLIVDGI